MSTKGTYHWLLNGRIHIYHNCLDNWIYADVGKIRLKLMPDYMWPGNIARKLIFKLKQGE